ncbi:MAG: rod-binding protein [Lachnospiraceae bacterium]|nr:rod-binding protein [Lachnospiraceae bacterium]
MDISTDYITSIANNALSESAAAKASTIGSAETESDEELLEACKSFEQYFLEQIFKEAQKTIMKDDSDMSASSKTLQSFYTDGLAEHIASASVEQGGIGLAQMMYEQMKRTEDYIVPSEN